MSRKPRLGAPLKTYRGDRKQDDVAAEFGITASSWSLLERGKRRPSPELASKLARKLGVRLETVLGVE